MTTITKLTPGDVAKLFRDLAQRFTRHHGNLKVEAADMTGAIVLGIRADRDDHPKLVGTQGKHILALQTLAAAIGQKAGTRVNLTLLEPTEGTKGPQATFTPNPTWKPDAMLALMRRVLDATLPGAYAVDPVRVVDLTTFQVTPQSWGPLCESGDLQRAIHAIFHAIGKSEGTTVHVEFVKPAPAVREPAAATV